MIIYFTVTNNLSYDRRMHRICNSLAQNGYRVVLVGRGQPAFKDQVSYERKWIPCIFNKGPLMYAEYNIRLFFILLFAKLDAICAIDLDTILPATLVASLRKKKRIYDAHEYFTGMKEVYTRPRVYKVWKWIERRTVPRYQYAYTVSEEIAEEFAKEYGAQFEVIRNLPILNEMDANPQGFLFYGGAVNEGRGLEQLIPAMERVALPLVIAGDGNFLDQAKALVREHKLGNKVQFLGMLEPAELDRICRTATIAIGLIENAGPNQYMALPNKFFDYMHCGVPQLTMNYPAIKRVNDKYNIGCLVDELNVETIATALNEMISNTALLDQMRANCRKARKVFNWQEEEKKLLAFYKNLTAE